MNGTNQGNTFEVIVGTSGNDVMTDAGGGGENKFWGLDGNDTISVANGTSGHLIGGNGNDTLNGADQDDILRGAAGNDIMNGAGGFDLARYDRPSTSTAFTHGAFVNLSTTSATYDFNGASAVIVLAGKAIDNWGDTDTLSSIENVRGSAFDDVIVGSSGDNELEGLDGDDVIASRGGNDHLRGGGGADSFVFGTGTGNSQIEDFVVGQDLLRLENGVTITSLAEIDDDGDTFNDTTVVTLSTTATVTLFGVTGIGSATVLAPTIVGTANAQTHNGTPGADVIYGLAGNDILSGLANADRLVGGRGDDTLIGGTGVDTYVWNAGDGFDTITAAGAVNENVILINGSFYDYNYQIVGNDLLVGVAVDDNYDWADVGGNLRIQNFLVGGDSIAYMEADLGPEFNSDYSPDGGNARIYFSAINGTNQGNHLELIFGTSGNDVMTDSAGTGINRLEGHDGNDVMSVSNGVQAVLIGGRGNDTMTGADQNDTLRGGSGGDIMNGGGGLDRVRYDRPDNSGDPLHGAFVNLSAASIVFDFNGMPAVTVLAGKAIDNWGDTDTLSNIEEVRGSNFGDVIVGNAGDNFIDGLDGNDIIVGGGGYDSLVGGGGADTFVFGFESDNNANIADFTVGYDSILLNDGLTIVNWFEYDGPDNDEIFDATLVTLSNGSTINLGNILGVDPNELLA